MIRSDKLKTLTTMVAFLKEWRNQLGLGDRPDIDKAIVDGQRLIREVVNDTR